MLIDHRFLSPHPRTVLWQQEREQCLTCANLRRPKAAYDHHTLVGSPLMRCSQAKTSCIDAREPGGRCGPGAVLYVPNVGVKPSGEATSA